MRMIPLLFILLIQFEVPTGRTYTETGYMVSLVGSQPEETRLFFKFSSDESKDIVGSLKKGFLELEDRRGRFIISNGYFHSRAGKSFLKTQKGETISMCERSVDTSIYFNKDIEVIPVRIQYRTRTYAEFKPKYNPFTDGSGMLYYLDCDTLSQILRMTIDSQKVIIIENIEGLTD